MRIAEDEAMPAGRRAASRVARWQAHRQFVILGRRLLRLLGASGFLADGPAASLHLAEVAGSVYLHPADLDD
jgi:alkylation response protein AidB-like acyl-CoA dehydrogenase